jgi:uncharacterized alkaline shock family protein YloU
MNKSKAEDIQSVTPVTPDISDDQGKLGEIQIALPVIENMVRMITLEVKGVVDVIGVAAGSISGIFSSKSDGRSGVKVIEDEAGAYSIEIRVSLQFGVELASVAYSIQNAVIEKISKMTSKGVTKVDVYIDRVEKECAKKPEAEPKPAAVKKPVAVKKPAAQANKKKPVVKKVEPKPETKAE